jgi:hypothetical protein
MCWMRTFSLLQACASDAVSHSIITPNCVCILSCVLLRRYVGRWLDAGCCQEHAPGQPHPGSGPHAHQTHPRSKVSNK